MKGSNRKMPKTGSCFVCGKMCGRGSYCVPCEGFACWTHPSPPVGRMGPVLDHKRCDHG